MNVDKHPDIYNCGDRRQIPTDRIVRSTTLQPRKYFSDESIARLATSIESDGIQQALIVRPTAGGKYELVAGERRYRAAKKLGLDTVPALVREMDDAEALRCALTENLAREDLNAIEETEGILNLLAVNLESSVGEVRSLLHRMHNERKKKVVTHSATGRQEAEIVKSTFDSLGRMSWDSFVSNQLPLLNLPPDILEAIHRGKIEYTKAKAIAGLKSEEERAILLEKAIAQNLTLRQVRELVRNKKASDGRDELEVEIADLSKQFRRSKARFSPQRRSEIEGLLKRLKSLLSENG